MKWVVANITVSIAVFVPLCPNSAVDCGGTVGSRAVPVTVVLSVLIAAGACAAAFALRPQQEAPGQSPAMRSCGPVQCMVLDRRPVDGGTAELWANADGTVGSLRVPGKQRFDVLVTDRGAKLTKGSLSCADGPAAACLVAGDYPDGRIADVFVANNGVWSKTDAEITSRNRYLGLYDSAVHNKGLEVIAVQTRCADGGSDVCSAPAYFAQVFSLTGDTLGCTLPVTSPDSLPGKPPDVQPEPENVHDCD